MTSLLIKQNALYAHMSRVLCLLARTDHVSISYLSLTQENTCPHYLVPRLRRPSGAHPNETFDVSPLL